MPYTSKFWKIDVRDEIVKEWTDVFGRVDDVLAGLHEIQERLFESQYDVEALERRQKEKEKLTNQDFIECQRMEGALKRGAWGE